MYSPRTDRIELRILPHPYGNPVVFILPTDDPSLYRWSYPGATKTIVVESDQCEVGGIINMTEVEKKKQQREEEHLLHVLREYGRRKVIESPAEFLRWQKDKLELNDEDIIALAADYEEWVKCGNDRDSVKEEYHQSHLLENKKEHDRDRGNFLASQNTLEQPSFRGCASPPDPSLWRVTLKDDSTTLQRLTRTLDDLNTPRRRKPHRTDPFELPRNTGGVTENTSLPRHPVASGEKAVDSYPSTHQPQEFEQQITLVESIIIETDTIRYPSCNFGFTLSPTPTTIASPQIAATASFKRNADPESAPYAYEVTTRTTQAPTSTTSLNRDYRESLSSKYPGYNFDIVPIRVDFPCLEEATAVVGQSVPTPTSSPVQEQNSKLRKAELCKRDILDPVEVVEINFTESLKITSTSTTQEKPTQSINPMTININVVENLKPEPRNRDFTDPPEDIEINTNHSSKITAIAQELYAASSVQMTAQKKQQVDPTPKLQRRDWLDNSDGDDGYKKYWDWYDRVSRDRKQYLWDERRTLREAYKRQRPGGRTLKEARLRKNIPHGLVFTGKKRSSEMPRPSNCRLDDMLEAPVSWNPACDPTPLPTSHPQISSGSINTPAIGAWVIVILGVMALAFIILVSFGPVRDAITGRNIPDWDPPGQNLLPATDWDQGHDTHSNPHSDPDEGTGGGCSDPDHDDHGSRQQPADDSAVDVESQNRTSTSWWRPICPWRYLQDHLCGFGSRAPDHDDSVPSDGGNVSNANRDNGGVRRGRGYEWL